MRVIIEETHRQGEFFRFGFEIENHEPTLADGTWRPMREVDF